MAVQVWPSLKFHTAISALRHTLGAMLSCARTRVLYSNTAVLLFPRVDLAHVHLKRRLRTKTFSTYSQTSKIHAAGITIMFHKYIHVQSE